MSKPSVKAFRRAIRYLDSGVEVERQIGTDTFICWAIERARDNGEITPDMARSAKDEIDKRLDPYSNVRYWLEDIAGIAPELLNRKNVQAYRHAWLQSLITEFSVKKG